MQALGLDPEEYINSRGQAFVNNLNSTPYSYWWNFSQANIKAKASISVCEYLHVTFGRLREPYEITLCSTFCFLTRTTTSPTGEDSHKASIRLVRPSVKLLCPGYALCRYIHINVIGCDLIKFSLLNRTPNERFVISPPNGPQIQ